MASKEQYVNIEFTKLYDMLIRSNEVISKDLIGWNQEDYDFLVNQLGLERNYSVELVKKVNFKIDSKIRYFARKRILNDITKKYLSNSDKEKVLLEKIYYDFMLKILK